MRCGAKDLEKAYWWWEEQLFKELNELYFFIKSQEKIFDRNYKARYGFFDPSCSAS